MTHAAPAGVTTLALTAQEHPARLPFTPYCFPDKLKLHKPNTELAQILAQTVQHVLAFLPQSLAGLIWHTQVEVC